MRPGCQCCEWETYKKGGSTFPDLKYLPAQDTEVQKTLLSPGDLVFNRTNSAELVGKSAVYKENHPSACFASYLIRVSFGEGCLPDYVCTFINSQHGRAYISQVKSQQVGQANVNGTKLGGMPIPLPPLAEQCRIVAEVERRLSVIRQAEATVEASLARAERLRQSIPQAGLLRQVGPPGPRRRTGVPRCWNASVPSETEAQASAPAKRKSGSP